MPLIHKPNIYIIPQGFLFQHSSTTDIPYDHAACICISIHLQCTELGSGKMDPYLGGNYMKSAMITLPECGTTKGRIDFFIPSKKWGIELLRDRDRLLAHNEQFVGGEYGKWVQAGMMDNYIMIDFRSTVPIMKLGNESSQLGRQSFIRIADLKCLYVVSTDGWQSMTIHNPELNKISNTWLLHD